VDVREISDWWIREVARRHKFTSLDFAAFGGVSKVKPCRASGFRVSLTTIVAFTPVRKYISEKNACVYLDQRDVT